MKPVTQKRTPLEISSELEAALKRLRLENHCWAFKAFSCFILWFVGLCLFIRWEQSMVAGDRNNIVPLLLSLLCILSGVILVPSARSTAVERLTELQDIRSVPSLIETLSSAHGAKARAVKSLLTQLLPRLTPTDALLFNSSHRIALWRELEVDNPGDDLDYLLAITAALEHIGNRDTMWRLRGLIARGAVTGHQEKIQAAAERSLIGLEARLAQEKVSGTLLRAADSAPHSEQLLRPVTSPPDAQTETLLQSAQAPSE